MSEKAGSKTGLTLKPPTVLDKTPGYDPLKRSLYLKACWKAKHPSTGYHHPWRERRDQIYRDLLKKHGLTP